MPRSWLLVPADHADHTESPVAGVDALILDLAGIAPQGRDPASFLVSARAWGSAPRLYARVNAFATNLVDRDLDAVMPGRPDGIVLPATMDGAEVSRLGAMLAVHEAETGLDDGATRIIAEVSSARGLFGLGSLAGASRRLAGIVWDAAALRRDVGGQTLREPSGALADPYRMARGLTLLAAAAAGVQAIDAPSYDELADPDILMEESRRARRDGFAGKLARHASEVPVINAAFASTA